MDEETLGGGGSDTLDPMIELKQKLLAAALPNVPFDGWSDAALRNAAEMAGVSADDAKLAFPRGGVDLALFFHDEGDRQLKTALAETDLGGMRIRDRVTFAVRKRLEIAEPHREAVRRGATLFALPLYASDGAKAVWSTADVIWTALGDSSEDLNWYSKRAILSGVYGSTTLYWIGDGSEGREKTWEFLARRIDGVMRFEKMKSAMRSNPLGRAMMAGPEWLASRVRKPGVSRSGKRFDFPGIA